MMIAKQEHEGRVKYTNCCYDCYIIVQRAMESVMGHAKSELLLDYIDWLLVAMGINHVRKQYPR